MIDKVAHIPKFKDLMIDMAIQLSVNLLLTDTRGSILATFYADSDPDSLQSHLSDMVSNRKTPDTTGSICITKGDPVPRQHSQGMTSMPLFIGSICVGYLVADPINEVAESVKTKDIARKLRSTARFVSVYLEMKQETDDLRERLRHAMDTDLLTGLGNHRACRVALEAQVQEAHRVLEPFSVALLSLDHFNVLNDTHGVKTGDDYLVAAATELQSALGESDLLFRDKGARFIVIMPHKMQREAIALTDHLKDCLESIQLKFLPEWRLIVNTGAASWKFGMSSVDDVLEAVDVALFKSRRQRSRLRSLSGFQQTLDSQSSHQSLDSINT